MGALDIGQCDYALAAEDSFWTGGIIALVAGLLVSGVLEKHWESSANLGGIRTAVVLQLGFSVLALGLLWRTLLPCFPDANNGYNSVVVSGYKWVSVSTCTFCPHRSLADFFHSK